MINRLQLLRNVGQFDSVTSKVDLARLTLVYAENGRGKTTLSAILRSLATGQPGPILERHRLGATNPPELIITCSGATQPARFNNGAWSRTLPQTVVFDDVFIDKNVYSGLEVGAEHRQNLHELIIGEQGVTLARQVVDLAEEIRARNSELRGKTSALEAIDKQGFDVDNFCALAAHDNIDDAILTAEKRLASISRAEAVRATTGFARLALPTLDTEALNTLLARTVDDVDSSALSQVKAHFNNLGKGAEAWVSTGMNYATANASTSEEQCPFCTQPLASSAMFASYRVHFAAAYKELVADVAELISNVENKLRGDALAGFERQLQTAKDRKTFWSAFCDVPDITIDNTELAAAWQNVRDAILATLTTKQADPLQKIELDSEGVAALSRFNDLTVKVNALNNTLLQANESIERVKETAKSANAAATQDDLKRLRATKLRFEPRTTTLCDEYLEAKAAKRQTETKKVNAQQALDAHRASVFPEYQNAINTYLLRLNAAFSIEQVQAQNAAGTPSCTYHLGINQHRVSITGKAGATFKNTLSAGDRNTLALAFFFASLDRDPNRVNKVVVLDDPVSSLDDHRTTATVQEARKLVQHVSQVIVLSHSKPFLARIWLHADQANTATLEVCRSSVGSTIAAWNVSDESVTEYDRRHTRLRAFRESSIGDPRDIAQAIRPVLEGYLRIACAADFQPGTLLGPFRNTAKGRAKTGRPILSSAKLAELEDLTEYANKFHHDTNPAWDTESINDGELHGFVQRTLAFVGP